MRPKSTVWTRAMLLLGLATSSTCGWMARDGKAVVLERLWNRMGLRLWLNPCSKGGQAHTSRAADQKRSALKEGFLPWSQHISNRFCPTSTLGVLQPDRQQAGGEIPDKASVPVAEVSGGRLRDKVLWGQGQRLGTWGIQQLLHGQREGWEDQALHGDTAHGDTDGIKEHCNKVERAHLVPRAWPRWVGCYRSWGSSAVGKSLFLMAWLSLESFVTWSPKVFSYRNTFLTLWLPFPATEQQCS